MKTPYGQECRYYHGDFYRGRDRQECRLVEQSRVSERWDPTLCRDCPVPGILRANGCPNLVIEGRVVKGFLGLTRHMQVDVSCTRSGGRVEDPYVGCGRCHEDRPQSFTLNLEDK